MFTWSSSSVVCTVAVQTRVHRCFLLDNKQINTQQDYLLVATSDYTEKMLLTNTGNIQKQIRYTVHKASGLGRCSAVNINLLESDASAGSVHTPIRPFLWHAGTSGTIAQSYA